MQNQVQHEYDYDCVCDSPVAFVVGDLVPVNGAKVRLRNRNKMGCSILSKATNGTLNITACNGSV